MNSNPTLKSVATTRFS